MLLVGNFFSSTRGARGVCEELAERLEQHGDLVVTTSTRRAPLLRLLDMAATAWRYRRVYSVAQVDVFSGNAFLWAEVACWTLRRAGKPYVLTLHGGNLPIFARRWPRRVRRLLASAAAVTVPSGYLQDQMRRYREDLLLLPNALDISLYPFRLREKASPHLVWVRAFHEIYNPSLAPRAVRLLAEQFPDVHLIMIGRDKGDGSLQRTQRIASDLGVAERIQFPGGVPKADVSKWLGRGDIFLNTTHVDNTPVSVLEAMASGLCVVSTCVGGIPYLLSDGRDSLLTPPDDPLAMTEAVTRVLTEPFLSRQLSQNARARAETLDWSAILPRWRSLIATVAAGEDPSVAAHARRR